MADDQPKTRAVLDRDFTIGDLVEVMSKPAGRRTIAMVLELCMHEQDAMAGNATHLAANVAKQGIANQIKDMAWEGGGKSLWRRMEDEIEIREDAVENGEQENDDDYDLAQSLDDDE